MRFKGGQYEFRASGGGSFLNGSEKSVERWQRSSSHYAQRPDRDYSPLDPTLTSLAGWSVQMNFDKTGGRHWLWGANTKIDSENFEVNDMAQLNGADGWLSNANIRWRETQPGKVFRNYYVQLDAKTDTTLRGLMQTGRVRSTFNVTWLNYWTSSINFARDLATTSVSLTRGGPLMARGPGWTTNVSVGNRSHLAHARQRQFRFVAHQRRWCVGEERQRHLLDAARAALVVLGVAVLRPRHRAAAVRQHAVGRPAGDVRQPLRVCVHRSQHDVDGISGSGLTLKPDVNLDVYAEPFAASGRYYDYGELLEPGSRERLKYGTSGSDPHGESRRQPGGERRRIDVHAAQSRFQYAVVPQQRGVALGMAHRQHALRGVAAGSRRAPRCSARASALTMRFDRSPLPARTSS